MRVEAGLGGTSAGSLDIRPVVGVGYPGRGDAKVPDSAAATTRLTMDEAGLAELYRKYAPAIFAHCRRLLHAPQAARDATQEAFVRVMARAPARLEGTEALRYLYRVATNVCLNQLRAEKVHDRATPSLMLRTTSAGTAEAGHADRQFAAALLDRCDDTGASIAVMHYVDGLSQVEIADTLGITRRTVFNRLRKLERLAAELLGDRRGDEAPAGAVGEGEARNQGE
jgi:RNA polymerase sigma-70 factor (ECF subfamily)